MNCAVCGRQDAEARGYRIGSEQRGFALLCWRCVHEAIENYWQVQYSQGRAPGQVTFNRHNRPALLYVGEFIHDCGSRNEDGTSRLVSGASYGDFAINWQDRSAEKDGGLWQKCHYCDASLPQNVADAMRYMFPPYTVTAKT